MAIHLYCQKCYTSNSLDTKRCSSCQTPFGKDRRFRVSVSVKGKRTSRVVENLTLAREIEATIKSDMVRQEYDITHHKVAKKVTTMDDLWIQYLPWAKEHKKTWSDDDYHYRKHLQPRFGSKALDSITSFDVEKMKSELKKGLNAHGKPYQPATIKHQLVLLRRLYNLARKWNLHDGKNPVDSVQMPKVDNQLIEFLSDEELSRLLDVLDSWPFREVAAFVKFAIYTGVRRGELFKLQWEHIDFDRALVRLVDPEGTKTMTIPVSPQALEVLSELDRTSRYVFPGDNGKQRVDFKSPWYRIREAAGLPDGFRFHGLRHNFASCMISNGVDLSTVGALLTHKNASTTQRYAHLRPDVVKQAADRSGELLTPGSRKQHVITLTERK
jgi:integrase